jgi:hypothetical protein
VSVGAIVRYVGQVLGRAHSLFGDPPASGGPATMTAGATLGGAGPLVRRAGGQVDAMSGLLPASYGDFAGRTAPVLDAMAAHDIRLGGALADAAVTDRSGRTQSGAVVDAAAADTAALAPWSGTAAGQKVLLSQLRGWLVEQQQVIAAVKARDARLAALVRSIPNPSRLGGAGGGMSFSPASFGAAPASGVSPVSGLSGLAGLPSAALTGNRRGRRVTLAAGHHGPASLRALGGLTSNSGPREVAATIIREAQRRGYSPQQTIAILSTAMQESGLNPRAVSPNGLWRSIFQQDSSYPGRDNPNTAISEFFERLSSRGGPNSPDIWKSIFWLQQAPGAPSAEAAYVGARRAYLSEIQGQHSAAAELYQDLTSAGLLFVGSQF